MLNVQLNVDPLPRDPESKPPVLLVTVCDTVSVFVQVTLVPIGTLIIAGSYPLLVIFTVFAVTTVGNGVAVPATVDTGVVISVAVVTGVAYDVPVTVVITTGVAVSIGITVSTGVITGVISAGVPPVGCTVALGLVVGP